MIPNEFENLFEIIHRLKDEDKELRVFGADVHRYVLGTPLKESVLQEFEQKHKITLPYDYRWFLTNIGDGAAGPYYGLFYLKDTMDECDASRAFIWTDKCNILDKATVDEDPIINPGVMQIGHQGCAAYSYLVVNGPTYGKVWTGHIDQFWPENLTFAAWYRRWMDKLKDYALPMLRNEQIVKRIKVGMTRNKVINICGGEWKEEKLAGTTFLTFKHLVTYFELNKFKFVTRIVKDNIFCR